MKKKLIDVFKEASNKARKSVKARKPATRAKYTILKRKTTGSNLENLSTFMRRKIWRARKQAQRAKLCKSGLEAHHPNYDQPKRVKCLTVLKHHSLHARKGKKK